MKKNIILLVAMSLTLSGCGIYTKYKPATSVPDDLYGGEVVTEDTAGLGNMDWRELFTDPHLQSLIETGLRTNTDYQSALLRVEEAQAALMSAKLAFLPAFALSPQGTVSSFDTNKTTQGYSLPVTASWELDVFGRMRNSKKQAKALYAQSEDYRQAVRTQLIAGIANTYYTLLMLDEQLIISRQTEEAWKETVASTRSLMNAGLANESAVSQMEATYYQVQGSVLDLQQQINQVENSLALLLAETPRNYERGTLADQQFPTDFAVGIPVRMLAARPDVRSAERTMDALAAAAGATRADWWPKFYLTGAFGYGNEYYKQFFKKENMTWQISPSIKWTIFSGRQIAQANRQAQIQLDEGINTYNQTLLTALQEVDDALSSYNKSLQQLDADRLALQEIKLTLEYAMDLYKKGLTNYQNVLDSQRNVLNYENVYVNSQSATLLYMIQVYKALGGGVEK